MPALRTLVRAAAASIAAVALTGSAAHASTHLPRVSGGAGHAPKISFPHTAPPHSLVVKVLRSGHGMKVRKKDTIAVNYVGEIWRGKVFDSSYHRQLTGVPIGVGQVIKGWDVGLVGKRVGSRVLLVIPPADGYGSKGNSAAGIKGKDTLVFVVDIVAAYTSRASADARAVHVASGLDGATVRGAMHGEPRVAVRSGAPEPKKAAIKLLDRGHGAKLKPGLVILQTLVTNWSGAKQASTWTIGYPDAETIGQKSAPSLLDHLVGKRIGSRFVAVIPKSGSSGPYVVVIDVVAQPHGTKSQPG